MDNLIGMEERTRNPGGQFVDRAQRRMLSEGHLDRLGGPPEGAHPIGGGRVELTVGEPEQWLPGHPDRVAVVQRARTLLAGCIADPDEVLARRRKRLRAARANDVEGLFPGPLR